MYTLCKYPLRPYSARFSLDGLQHHVACASCPYPLGPPQLPFRSCSMSTKACPITPSMYALCLSRCPPITSCPCPYLLARSSSHSRSCSMSTKTCPITRCASHAARPSPPPPLSVPLSLLQLPLQLSNRHTLALPPLEPSPPQLQSLLSRGSAPCPYRLACSSSLSRSCSMSNRNVLLHPLCPHAARPSPHAPAPTS